MGLSRDPAEHSYIFFIYIRHASGWSNSVYTDRATERAKTFNREQKWRLDPFYVLGPWRGGVTPSNPQGGSNPKIWPKIRIYFSILGVLSTLEIITNTLKTHYCLSIYVGHQHFHVLGPWGGGGYPL